jgi:hypothetical protein
MLAQLSSTISINARVGVEARVAVVSDGLMVIAVVGGQPSAFGPCHAGLRYAWEDTHVVRQNTSVP